MLASVIKYSGVYAKTCALKSQLLKYSDFQKLASAENVSSFADILGHREAYKEAVLDAMELGSNRVAIERSLLKSLYRDYAALYSFITEPNERKYLDVFFLKYSADIIKKLLRWIFDHRDISKGLAKYESFITSRIGLDIEKIEQSKTIDELLENVKGTEFYNVLAKIDKDKASLFDYEMQLDFHCYIRTHGCQEKTLTQKELISARRLSGEEVDLQNILWIYRARAYYDISADEIFTYLIPLHYMLSFQVVKELVKSGDREGFFEIISKTHYKDVFEEASADRMELCVRSYLNKLYEGERRKNPYSLISVVSLLHQKMQEIQNLTTLVECVRYSLAPQASLDKLALNYLPDFPNNVAVSH